VKGVVLKRGEMSKPKMKRACVEAQQDLADVSRHAELIGIYVRVSRVRCSRKKRTLHIMFETNDRERLLDYWPGTGRTYSKWFGSSCAPDLWSALAEALKIKNY
jgi:hypothetical protein